MSCELRVNILAGCIYRTSYELQVSFLLELRVTFCMQVMSYCLLYYLRVTFCMVVRNYCLFHDLRVSFVARVTSYNL